MYFTDEEQVVFKDRLQYSLEGPSSWIEPGLLMIYNWYNATESQKHDTTVVLGFIKRKILEFVRKKGYKIIGNETFDIDELINGFIKNDSLGDTAKSRLVGFNSEHYKDPNKMREYFGILINNTSIKELEYIKSDLEYTNDNFRQFFVSHVIPILDNMDDICKESVNDISEKDLLEFIKFINTLPQLLECRNNGLEMGTNLYEILMQRKQNDFNNDENFRITFDIIMNHDQSKSTYYFHGTQDLESAQKCLGTGLLLTHDDLYSTAVRELSKEQVIGYEIGLGGLIGRDAIVIVDVPKDENGREIKIDIPNENRNTSFVPSGLQGFDGKPNYVIPPEFIVGYIDKKNKRIVFNPMYRDYNRFGINSMNM